MRPWMLRIPQQLKGARHLQHAQIIKALAGNLQANRETGAGVAAIDRGRNLHYLKQL